jgi:hypothetical protein
MPSAPSRSLLVIPAWLEAHTLRGPLIMQQLSRFVNYNGGPFVSGAGPTAAVFSQSRLAHRAVQLNTENELPKHTKTAPVPEP